MFILLLLTGYLLSVLELEIVSLVCIHPSKMLFFFLCIDESLLNLSHMNNSITVVQIILFPSGFF